MIAFNDHSFNVFFSWCGIPQCHAIDLGKIIFFFRVARVHATFMRGGFITQIILL